MMDEINTAGTAEIKANNGLIKRNILIVEDNEINREMLKEILSDDYNVIEAVDGLDGLEKLNQNYRNLSLVLLDVQMPRMDGFEFLVRYRTDAILSSVPIIVTTGSTEDEAACLAAGASDFVTKPYAPTIILRRIEAIIRLHESINALRVVEHDSLTGLYNKTAFCHHVQALFNRTDEERYDMFMVNVEDFSHINERYGESKANELLKHLGKQLLQNSPEAIFSCRYTADRFVIVRKHIEDCDHHARVVPYDKLIHKGAPINDFTLKYATYDDVDKKIPVSVLCDRLALAVATIRHQYKTIIAPYEEVMSHSVNRKHQLTACMRESLKKKEFKVYYQPKNDAKTGKIIGAEALVRWIHPELGFISPGEFIPTFEENGLITDLDLYVLDTVCRDMKAWRDNGIDIVPVSINASRRDFLALNSIKSFQKSITSNKIDKKYIHFEITESLCVANDLVVTKIRALRDEGFTIELDDFGAGQSSLGSISDIPMDVIKLDMSFVRNLEKKREVVRMIISLAHALGLKTVAEGVETKDQLDTLIGFGCDYIQGYYFSKPLCHDDFTNYLINTEHLKEN